MKNAIKLLMLMICFGCADIEMPVDEIKTTPKSIFCGWFLKGTYDVGNSDVALMPTQGSAVSWPGTDPCDVDDATYCWPANSQLQLWARADTSGDLHVEKLQCMKH